MAVTVNRQTTFVDALLAKFETDSDLQSWARTFSGVSTFAFRYADSGENVRLTVYDEITEMVMDDAPIAPLQIYVTYPASNPKNAGPVSSGNTAYAFTASMHVIGVVQSSQVKKVMEFAEALLRVIFRTDTVRPFRVESIQYQPEQDPSTMAVNITLAIDWHHSVEG